MSSEPKTQGQQRASRRALFTLLILSLVLLGAVVAPLAKAFFLAAVLGGALYPLVSFLTRKLRRKQRSLAAGLTVFAVVLVLLAPISGLAAFAIGEASKAVQFVSETVRSEGMTGLIERLPSSVGRAVRWVIDRLPVETQSLGEQLGEGFGAQGGKAAAAVGGVLSATGSFVFQSVMMLIALYAVLVEGRRLMLWLEQISPLEQGQFTELLMEFRRTSVAVMLSSAATAGVQALAALGGYLIARVPHPLFFAALTFFIALVPAVGAASVCLVAALLLLVTGHTVAGVFLAIWAVVVVGLIDNVVKPIFAKRGMDMNAVVIFFSLIGGLASFGALGLLIGPLAVALFLAVVRIWHRSYGKGPGAAETVAEATTPP
ncbi:MAG: AI-2E family transporter [Myxococcaceae bacterium]